MKNPARVFSLLLALSAAAATAQSPAPMKTMALSFNINGLNLSGLNGGTGGKLWISGNRALVASVDAGYYSETREDEDTASFDDRSSERSLQFNVGMEQHYEWAPGLSPYLMGGVSLAYGRYTSESGNIFSGRNRSEQSTITPGINTGFGLEYWIAPRVSIAGQQLFSATYGIGEQSNSNSSFSNSQDLRTFTLSLGTSSLILSVYL